MGWGFHLRTLLGLPAVERSDRSYGSQYIGNDSFPGAGGLSHYPSAPWAGRLEGNDIQSWIEPVDADHWEYQTFAVGNRLPGSLVMTTPDTIVVGIAPELTYPQRDALGFGPQLGQIGSQNIMQHWRDVWAQASARAGG